LRAEQAALDRIFGAGNYDIEDVNSDEAIVRTSGLEVRFTYDRSRLRDVSTSMTIFGVPDQVSTDHRPDALAHMLGQEIPTPPVDAEGFFALPPEEQVRDHLKWLARFVEEIFSDPQRTRDAAHFGAGYNAAYGDWASRKGSWAD
jgi:hypothetical protein